MATTLEMLLDAINRGGLPPVPGPAPSMPLPVGTPPLAGPALGVPPDVPPVAPLPAADTAFISQFAGPAPVAPTLPQPSFIDKLSTALLGVSAGLQGRAPQFIESVREERLRPIREYQQQLERFQSRRTQGVELDERRRERQQDRATRQAEAKAEREFQQFIRRANFTDEQAILQARQAFELNKLREQERIQDERDAARAAAETEKQRRNIENELATKDGAPSNIAKEISEWRVGLRAELSAAAQKWRGLQAKKAEAQLAKLARIGAGGGSGGGQVMAQLANGQTVPASLVNREQGGVLLNGQLVPVVQYVGGSIPRQAQSPAVAEAPGGVGPPVPATEILPGGIQMTTPAPTLKRSAAKAKLVKNGYSSKEADAELDRLGIQ